MPVVLSGIFRYPIKSTHREALTSIEVEPWGLSGDRRWMLVDEEGRFITARENPRLLLVTAQILDHGLRLVGPAIPDLQVPTPAIPVQGQLDVNVWRSHLLATPAHSAAHDWFTEVLGRPVRLVYLDDPTRRATNPNFSLDSDRVSFADGYPLLLTAEASLARLNDWIAEGPRPQEGPLPMTRFRPNVVISGIAAFEEDSWRRIRIGEARFRVASACARCVLTTIDQETAGKGKEPITSLARHRRWDGQTWFGVNLIPDLEPGERPTLRLGDEIEVLAKSESLEPLRIPELHAG